MDNVAKLFNAGVILAGTVLSQADKDTINGLTDSEIAAIISLKGKLWGGDFLNRNCSVSSPAPAQGVRAIGIVF